MYEWDILGKFNNTQSVVDQLLSNRGITTKTEKEMFLRPPPFSFWFQRLPKELLLSLKKAKELIEDSMQLGRTIVIHGDYDADGICATAIMYKTIKNELKYENIIAFMPNRFDHGYGFSKKSIDTVCKSLPKGKAGKNALFITVDCGITSAEEVDYLKTLGYEVIITDHHQKPHKLPSAKVIVWYDQIVGTTLAYLLARVLGGKDRDLISYCCVATVTDLQPILNFNRTIVKEGLEIINKKPPLGIKLLLDVSGKADKEVTAYDLGWIVGPRLNATGRVEDAKNALALLLEEEADKARDLAWELNKVNVARQDKTIEMYELAEGVDPEDLPKIIISQHDNYHEGIIGLVASKLVQKFHRPAVVISTAQDVAKGSARSIKGLNIIEALRSMDDGLFISLGGHPMAAGFSILRENIDILKDKLISFADQNVKDDMLIKNIEIDMELPSQMIDEQLISQIERLRPFGIGNNPPTFCSRKLDVAGVNVVGKEQQHLTLRLYDGINFLRGIFFNYKDHLSEDIKVGDKVDAAYNLKKNEYNGKVAVELVLKDIKKLYQI